MSMVDGTSPARAEVCCERRADDTLLRLVGNWRIYTARPVVSEVYTQLDASPMVDFIGVAVVACLRLVGGAARCRRVDLVLFMQEYGAQAFRIMTLISFLIGLILAFMGAIQLRQFGAQIYVADLVGLGMTREMGAVMSGIIMAGRTGALFAFSSS